MKKLKCHCGKIEANINVESLDKILKDEIPKPGSYRGRINNEPENGRKTLMELKNA